MVMSWLWNRDENLDQLLQIAIEGSELDSHDFEEALDIYKETSSRVIKRRFFILLMNFFFLNKSG